MAQEHIYSFGVNLHGQLETVRFTWCSRASYDMTQYNNNNNNPYRYHEEKGSNTTSSSSSSNLVKLNMERESVSAMGVGSRHCGVALSSGKLFKWRCHTRTACGYFSNRLTAQSRKAMKEGTKVEIIFGKRKGCEGILIREVKPKRWLSPSRTQPRTRRKRWSILKTSFGSTIAPSPPPPLFPSMMITLPQQVKLPIKVLILVCGDTHTIAVLEDRTVFSRGSGKLRSIRFG